MNLPEHVHIKEDALMVRHSDGRWLPDMKRMQNESDSELYIRWLEALTDQETNKRLERESQRINNIISWIVPILLMVLSYFLSAFFVDSN